MINRAAILLRHKEPAIRWINEADPADDDPGITAAEVNCERTVYLICDLDGDTQQSVDRWIKHNYQELFETELEDLTWSAESKIISPGTTSSAGMI